jgi:hypothetical protein
MEERIQEHGQPGSRLDTKEAKKRCEAATPEPWTVERGVDSSLEEAYVAMGEKNPGGWWDYDSTWLQRDEDADFIAHARSDLPATLEALEEAQQENGRLKAVLGKAKRQHNWETHGYYEGDEAGCLDCQRYADVL